MTSVTSYTCNIKNKFDEYKISLKFGHFLLKL